MGVDLNEPSVRGTVIPFPKTMHSVRKSVIGYFGMMFDGISKLPPFLNPPSPLFPATCDTLSQSALLYRNSFTSHMF